jgi:hypothetical protein
MSALAEAAVTPSERQTFRDEVRAAAQKAHNVVCEGVAPECADAIQALSEALYRLTIVSTSQDEELAALTAEMTRVRAIADGASRRAAGA